MLLVEGLLGVRVVVTRPLDLLRVALLTAESEVLSSDDTGGFAKLTERSLLLFRLEPGVLLMGFCKLSDLLESTVALLLLELMWSGSGRDFVLRLALEDWLKSLESDVVPSASVSLLLLLVRCGTLGGVGSSSLVSSALLDSCMLSEASPDTEVSLS